MKIGIVVDGQSEFRSLPQLLDRIEGPHTMLKPLYADIQPFAPVQQIVRAVKTRVPILKAKRADMALILLDRESRGVCPGSWAAEIQAAVSRKCTAVGIDSFAVVVKNSCYENWLVSDPLAFERMPKRFNLSFADTNKIQPNKADRVNAQAMLKRAARGSSYSKVDDAVKIMQHADPLRMASNSRSFRRFMRLVGNPHFLDQSRRPSSDPRNAC